MANTAVHSSALDYLKDRIDALITAGTLPSPPWDADSVVIRDVPLAAELKQETRLPNDIRLPAILICPWDKERIKPSSNLRDDRGFPCLVQMVIAVNRDAAYSDARIKYRQDLIDEFVIRAFSGTDPAVDFNQIDIEPGPIIDLEIWTRFGWWCSWFVAVCWTEMSRGN